MTRLVPGALIILGRRRGSSLPASSALLDGLDAAIAVGDGCSPSSSSCRWDQGCVRSGLQLRTIKYERSLAQPIDTNHISALLESATLLEHAALPVLQYGAWFDPEQVTRTLQRIPRMLRYQRRKGLDGATAEANLATAQVLLQQLGSRLVQVAPDCSDEQLARALWAYGVSRHFQPEVVRSACELLPRRLHSMSIAHLATAAWGLAVASSRAPEQLQQPVRELLQTVAQHLTASRPASLTAAYPPTSSAAAAPASSSSASPSSPTSPETSSAPAGEVLPAADVVAAAAGRSALEADRPWMDPRSALKLAWAFATAQVTDTRALDVVGDAAAARITSQLQAHDWSSGPLSPRATYIYRTIRGWQAWPRPRPPRAGTGSRRSRYLRDERPRVVLRDFTLGSLAPLLSAFRRLGHRHEGLLQAATQHVVSSGGASLRVAPTDLVRVVGALEALRFPSPSALTTLLAATQLADLPAPLITRLTALAADWGVSRKAVYGRLARQLVARAWLGDGDGDGNSGDARTDAAAPLAAPAAAAAGVAAKDLAVVDEAAAAAAKEAADAVAAAADAAAAASQEVRLDDRALAAWEARSRETWRSSDAALAREERAWREVFRSRRDMCSAAEVARALLALAKVGYQDPQTDFISSLFALLHPALPRMPRDAVVSVAFAAVRYTDVLDHASAASHSLSADSSPSDSSRVAAARVHVPPALDLIRDATNVVLYGTMTGVRPEKQDLRRRLLELAGYGSSGGSAAPAAADVAATDAQAAALRADLGLSAGGALRLALALTARPEAVLEKEMKAALSLLDIKTTSRQQLGKMVAALRQRGRNGSLPPRLLAAVGEGDTAAIDG